MALKSSFQLNFYLCSQSRKGFQFESETDTEIIAKLIKHLHDTFPCLSFRELVEQVILQLVNNSLFNEAILAERNSIFSYRKEHSL
jgi:glucosamine 6-phosphate synthetase-like amidotransferase/phosphosugar isomerase protein